MSDNLIDHETVRARVEKRLEPRLKLLRRRAWLIAHFVIFLAGMLIIYSTEFGKSIFYWSSSYTIPASRFLDADGKPFEIAAQTVWTSQPYPATNLLTVLWFLAIVIYALNLWSAFSRERAIQREVDREMELEKMRMQLELGGAGRASGNEPDAEKPKRVARLSDDGELLYEQESARRGKNHRNS